METWSDSSHGAQHPCAWLCLRGGEEEPAVRRLTRGQQSGLLSPEAAVPGALLTCMAFSTRAQEPAPTVPARPSAGNPTEGLGLCNRKRFPGELSHARVHGGEEWEGCGGTRGGGGQSRRGGSHQELLCDSRRKTSIPSVEDLACRYFPFI